MSVSRRTHGHNFVVRVFESWWNIVWALAVTISGTLCLLILLSNTFTASARVVWNDCADNWLAVWTFLRMHFSMYTLSVVGTFVVHASVYWICNAGLLWVDLYHPERWQDFKIQEDTNSPLDTAKVARVVVCTCRNLLMLLPVMHVIYNFMDPSRVFSSTLPSFNRMIVEIVFFVLCEEVLFYYSHRAMHHKWLYGPIHKQHHEWTSPIGLVSIYCHPVEHFLSNLVPVMVGPIILQSHLMVIWVWAAFAIFTTVCSHSGCVYYLPFVSFPEAHQYLGCYHLPFMSSPEAHDYHHLKFNEIFGVLGVLDYLHGTDAKFRASRQFELHKTFFTDAYKDERIRKPLKQVNARDNSQYEMKTS